MTFRHADGHIDAAMHHRYEGMSEWCCGKSTFSFRGEALPYLSYAVKLFRSGRRRFILTMAATQPLENSAAPGRKLV